MRSRTAPRGICLLTSLPLLLAAACERPPERSSGPEALVTTIAEAAKARDYETLSAHMAEAFSYSFGHAPSREGALDYYREQPERLDELAEVLGGECAYRRDLPETWFVCPAAAADPGTDYYGWRAGLRQTDEGDWELVWFVAGD